MKILSTIGGFFVALFYLVYYFLFCGWLGFFGVLYFLLCPYIDETDVKFVLEADTLNHFENWL